MLWKTGIYLTILAIAAPLASAYACNESFSDLDLCSNQTSLCAVGETHIDCLNATFGMNCTNGDVYEFPPNDALRVRIVYILNQIRNTTAGGLTKGLDDEYLPKAARMGYAFWDCELAYLAMKQAMQCDFYDAPCLTTDVYPKPSQLMYVEFGEIGNLSYGDTVENAFAEWNDTGKYVSVEDVSSYKPDHGSRPFAIMVKEQNNAFGCGFTKFQVNITHEAIWFICNFADTPKPKWPLYTQGTLSRTACVGYGRSHNNLCDIGERYSYDRLDVFFCENEGPSMCPVGQHIACQTITVNSTSNVTLTTPLQTNFIAAINKCRNLVAGGTIPGTANTNLPKGKRTAAAAWSTDLERMAQVYAQTCSRNKDDCHNSISYPNAGQTIYIANITANTTVAEIITSATDAWCQQSVYVDATIIASYVKSTAYEDFCTMVHERNLRVGCAIATNTVTGQACVVCNYATIPVVGCPVYHNATIAASGCNTTSNFINLCSSNEYLSPTVSYRYFLDTCTESF